MIYTLTMKTTGVCDSCGCDPCDCSWGNYITVLEYGGEMVSTE